MAHLLDSVARWDEATSYKKYIESDLVHVNEMFAMLYNEVTTLCPILYKNLNIDLLIKLIPIHDMGEIGRGDVPNTTSSIDSKIGDKMKDREVCWGKYILRKIADEDLKKELIDLFIAYEFRNLEIEQDKETCTGNPYHKVLTTDQEKIIKREQKTLQFHKILDLLQAEKYRQNNVPDATQIDVTKIKVHYLIIKPLLVFEELEELNTLLKSIYSDEIYSQLIID